MNTIARNGSLFISSVSFYTRHKIFDLISSIGNVSEDHSAINQEDRKQEVVE